MQLLVLWDTHQTGSGQRYYATGFRCVAGKLQEVFQRRGASLYHDRVNSTAIVVGKSVVSGKPVRKHWIYVWNSAGVRYVVSGTYSTPK